MKRIALDTDAVSSLADMPALIEAAQGVHARGTIVFIVSHVVYDQLAETPDADKRARFLATWDAMPKKIVRTRGAAWGISRLGEATWGNGLDSGVTVDMMRTEGRGGVHDALIATTASGEADVLVTNDGELAAKVREAVRQSKARCAVWSFGRLRGFLRAQSRQAASP